MKPREPFDKLVAMAMRSRSLSSRRTAQDRVRAGETIPDDQLPGRFLARCLTVEEFKAIIFLKSEDTWVRPDAGPGHFVDGLYP